MPMNRLRLGAMLVWVLFQSAASATTILAASKASVAGENKAKNMDEAAFQESNIANAMHRFVQAPHPMGSAEQRKLTREIKTELNKAGWKTEIEKFKATIPNLSAERFGGAEKKAPASKPIEGENIVAVRKGTDHCAVILAGHYDTKNFKSISFVGANDGGSSTVVMQEFARVLALTDKKSSGQNLKKSGKSDEKNSGRYQDCTVVLAFFDGEEATLNDWSDGETQLGLQDNLYGSRAFAESLNKGKDGPEFKGLPVKLAIIIDMVGHKDQNLFITSGSEQAASQKLVALKNSTQIAIVNMAIEDDHVPFLKQKVPFVHIIDWTNLKEWHTAADNADIISASKLSEFGNLLVRFFGEKREDAHG